jgi:hypothetical protein
VRNENGSKEDDTFLFLTISSKIRAVEAHFGGVQATSIQIDAPDLARALNDYRGAVDDLKRKYGLITISG